MDNNHFNHERAFQNAKKKVEEIKNYFIFVVVYVLIVAFLLLSNFTQKMGIENTHRNFLIVLQGLVLLGYGIYLFIPKFQKWEQRKIRELMQKEKSEIQ